MSEDRGCNLPEGEAFVLADGANSASASKPIRVLLVEGDAAYSADIVDKFRLEGLTVKAARTIAEARDLLHSGKNPVDVVICALHLPDGQGESLLPDIDACACHPTAIFIGEFVPDIKTDSREYHPVARAKLVSAAVLLRNVRNAIAGHTLPVIHRFVKRFKLTRRESEATFLLAQGLRVKEIADHMFCSEKTVYAHLVRVSKKTGCRDYHEVVCLLLAFSCRVLGQTAPKRPSAE